MQQFPDRQFLLEWARDVGRTFPFLDFHVHPFDVITGDMEYRLDDQVTGLYHKGSAVYQSPTTQAEEDQLTASLTRLITEKSVLLTSRLAYIHTGPKVLTDQLDLAGLTGALLLPVARLPGIAENLLKITAHMFPQDGRFFAGCAFPVGVPADKLEAFFRSAHGTSRIRAIKFHPSLTGVDPLTDPGRGLIEAMLAAAGVLDLPIVVHAGWTPALEPPQSREYGLLTHLSDVDWSISPAPVILAHAGLYYLTEQEAVMALDTLKRLFEKHPNLMADTSNLDAPVLRLVLEKMDPSRLLFGSDALYVPIWKSWVRFLQGLRLVSKHPDDDLICIASLNPRDCLRMHPLQ